MAARGGWLCTAMSYDCVRGLTRGARCDTFRRVPAVGEAYVSSRQIRSRGLAQFTDVMPQCGEGERERRATHLLTPGLRNRLSHRSAQTQRPALSSGPLCLLSILRSVERRC